jgi:type II secretory pathway predicted ATPase ExeA
MTRTMRRPAVEARRAFQPTADRSSLWLVGQYDDALRMLRAQILNRQGLLLLVGEPGTGKTVLAHALGVRMSEEGVAVGRLLYPILEGMDLRVAVAEAFDLPSASHDRDVFLDQFRQFVAETAAAGRRVLLIVDEAQTLTSDLLVELAGLPYAGEPGNAASMSVLLVGQHGLVDTLRAEGVEADVLCHLRPLTRDETTEYIAYRLRAAGHRGRLFTPTALRKIWVVSEGIPRVVNMLCVEALTSLRGSARRTVTTGMIDRSARDRAQGPTPEDTDIVSPEAPEPSPGAFTERSAPRVTARRRVPWVAVAAAVGLTLGGAWGVAGSARAPWLSSRTASATVPTAVEVQGGASVAETPEATVSEIASLSALPSEEAVAAALPEPTESRVAAAAPAKSSARATPSPARSAAVARHPATVPAPAAPAGIAADANDATGIIDWLLKDRRAGGSNRRD